MVMTIQLCNLYNLYSANHRRWPGNRSFRSVRSSRSVPGSVAMRTISSCSSQSEPRKSSSIADWWPITSLLWSRLSLREDLLPSMWYHWQISGCWVMVYLYGLYYIDRSLGTGLWYIFMAYIILTDLWVLGYGIFLWFILYWPIFLWFILYWQISGCRFMADPFISEDVDGAGDRST